MATRAEQARAEAERSGPKKPKTPKRLSKRYLEEVYERTEREALAATSGRPAGAKTARSNIKRDHNHATFALEDSPHPKRSRKSTRKTTNRVKPDSNLRSREVRRDRAPKTRATKAAAERMRGPR
jgi:hypothetical protein